LRAGGGEAEEAGKDAETPDASPPVTHQMDPESQLSQYASVCSPSMQAPLVLNLASKRPTSAPGTRSSTPGLPAQPGATLPGHAVSSIDTASRATHGRSSPCSRPSSAISQGSLRSAASTPGSSRPPSRPCFVSCAASASLSPMSDLARGRQPDLATPDLLLRPRASRPARTALPVDPNPLLWADRVQALDQHDSEPLAQPLRSGLDSEILIDEDASEGSPELKGQNGAHQDWGKLASPLQDEDGETTRQLDAISNRAGLNPTSYETPTADENAQTLGVLGCPLPGDHPSDKHAAEDDIGLGTTRSTADWDTRGLLD